MDLAAPTFGTLLRDWRERRRLSQLHLAAEAQISQRHLSFVESGRSTPSRAMVLRLADQLSVPLRERNVLLVAAGYAPAYRERTPDDPGLAAAWAAVELILKGHEPHPALAVDRHWTLQLANDSARALMVGVEPALIEPPVNVLRLSLHPHGLAPRIRNLPEWRAHVLARIARDIEVSADTALIVLRDELRSYPAPIGRKAPSTGAGAVPPGIVVPFELDTEAGLLRFISTTTVFGTAVDIGLAELAIESFFPADAETAAAMRKRAHGD
jgi:transcriptional regulator with XRE-family HTH domain